MGGVIYRVTSSLSTTHSVWNDMAPPELTWPPFFQPSSYYHSVGDVGFSACPIPPSCIRSIRWALTAEMAKGPGVTYTASCFLRKPSPRPVACGQRHLWCCGAPPLYGSLVPPDALYHNTPLCGLHAHLILTNRWP